VPALAAALLALLAVAAPPAAAATAPRDADDAPRLDVQIAAGEPTVGDHVDVDLVLDVPSRPAEAPRFPAWEDAWGEAEIVSVGEVTSEEPADGRNGVVYRQRVTVAAFRPGRVALPPQQVVVPAGGEAGQRSRTLTTPADLALDIHSVLPAASEDGGAADGTVPTPPPQPARPPVEYPVGARFWWTAGLLAAALVALAALLWRRRRRRLAGTEAGAPALPPFAELSRHLDAARRDADPADGLTRVSLALRRYLGRRLAFPAAESTTSEIRRQLAARRLPDGVARRCGELLGACDLVKFARRPATTDDVATWADAAADTARRIEEHLRPLESESEAEGDAAPPRREAA
jgi:hypothetical protein